MLIEMSQKLLQVVSNIKVYPPLDLFALKLYYGIDE